MDNSFYCGVLPVKLYISGRPHRMIHHYLDYWNQVNGQFIFQTQTFALIVARYWDRGVVELLGPFGLLRFFHYATFQIELLATGFFSHYAFLFILAIASYFLLFSSTALMRLGRMDSVFNPPPLLLLPMIPLLV